MYPSSTNIFHTRVDKVLEILSRYDLLAGDILSYEKDDVDYLVSSCGLTPANAHLACAWVNAKREWDYQSLLEEEQFVVLNALAAAVSDNHLISIAETDELKEMEKRIFTFESETNRHLYKEYEALRTLIAIMSQMEYINETYECDDENVSPILFEGFKVE